MKATLLTCTPDSTSSLFRKHMGAVKKFTRDFEHIILDNNRAPGFNHAKEINRALKIARGDFLVLLDDDCIVREGWLEGLIHAAAKNRAAVAGGIHRYLNDQINHAGAWLTPEGGAVHHHSVLRHDLFCPYVCSAVFLINREIQSRHTLFFDENFQKYYQEADFCLTLWEKGQKTVCTPRCDVYHLEGRAFQKRKDADVLAEKDRNYFIGKWVARGRLEKILKKNNSVLGIGSDTQWREFMVLREAYREASVSNSITGFKRVFEKAPAVICRPCGENFESGAAFHLGRLYACAGKNALARKWLEVCLRYEQNHKAAAAILKKISKG